MQISMSAPYATELRSGAWNFAQGNVGIGTDSPLYNLDIAGTSTRIRVQETTSNTASTMIEVENSDGRGAMLGVGGSGRTDLLTNRGFINAQFELDGLAIGTEGIDPIIFYTQGLATSNERMRITSAGNVVINSTTTPYVDDKLYIAAGNAIIDNNKSYLQYTNGGARAAVLTLNSSNNLFVGQNNANNANLFLYGGTGNVIVNAGAIEVARFTTSGNVGIGRTSIAQPTTGATTLAIQGTTTTSAGAIRLYSSDDSVAAYIFADNANGLSINTSTSHPMVFRTVGVERMRITSGGNILAGKIVTGQVLTDGFEYSTDNYLSICNSVSANYSLYVANKGASGTRNMVAFYGTSSSDYRLKEDLKDFNGLDKVSKISVYDFKWKSEESRSYGVMAHELQEVLPDAVSGEKDAEENQMVDYSKIVPLLIKSIQELKAEVDKLKQECNCKN
jgi:hypothetical protein